LFVIISIDLIYDDFVMKIKTNYKNFFKKSNQMFFYSDYCKNILRNIKNFAGDLIFF